MAKAAASLGFLVVAAEAQAWATPHGQAICLGLGLSWFGDVFLLSKARRWFLAGLVAFLLGHVAYVVAFALRGLDPAQAALLAPAIAGVGFGVWRWLSPHLSGMRRLLNPRSWWPRHVTGYAR